MSAPILVIGATGTTGSRVCASLRQRGAQVRAASRSGADDFVRFDWYDKGSWPAVVQGVEALYLIAPVGDPEPGLVVRPFLDLAVAQGVKRVVLLSSSAVEPGPTGLGALHRLVVDTAEEWAVLRPSWFMQNFVGDLPQGVGVRAGRITTATGTGRVAFIDADDIARVAVELLLADEAPRSEYVLTGPEALSYEDVCSMASDVRGSRVEVEHVTPEELAGRLATAGIPAGFAEVLAELDRSISKGSEDRVTDVVEVITGRAPRPMRLVLAEQLR